MIKIHNLKAGIEGNEILNGINLGKYWQIGPQQTLYVPAEWLKVGANKVTVLELLKTETNVLTSVEKPVLDKVVK